ncbi:MAG TPA: two-component regulator propeller domain-containing protein, partial [Anaerolineales bacterium]
MQSIRSRFLGLVLLLLLTSCGRGVNTPATATAALDSAPPGRPLGPSHVAPASLPQICNCVLRFDHISIEQGLSQSSVKVILQDRRGFLWFGTEDGLNRYDGYNVKIYKPDPDAINSLSDRWITSIVEDQDGYLWIGTRLGLNRYDPYTEEFIHFIHDDANPVSLIDNHINVLYMDKKDNLWIGTTSGLDLFDRASGTFKHYVYSPSQQEGISGKSITALYQDSRGRFWVGTFAGG